MNTGANAGETFSITVIAQQFFRNYFFTYFQWITSVLTGYAAGSSLAAQ